MGFPGPAKGLQGFLACFGENSADWREVKSLVAYLPCDLFIPRHPLVPSWTWIKCHSVLSDGPHYLGLFLILPLGSQGWSHCFSKPEVIMKNATFDPWRSARKAKSPQFVPGPQQGTCLVLLVPIEWEQICFITKGRLYSLIKEWRVQACTLERMLSPKGSWWVCLIGYLSTMWGQSSGRLGTAMLLMALLMKVSGTALLHTVYATAILMCPLQFLCTQPAGLNCYTQPFCTRNSSLKHWVLSLCTQPPVSKWN